MHKSRREGMIYLDSAATSLQKPAEVGKAMFRAVRTMASPGRGGHAAAMRAAEMAFRCRSEIAELFNIDNPEQVVFTMNATHGLNIAIHDMVSPGDRVVVSGYEHNSVIRALHMCGANIDVAESPLFEPDAAVQIFREKLTGAKAAVVCHVSNVFGYILPIGQIAKLCEWEGVPLLIDASQSAGCIPIDFGALGAEYIAMPGHKGLLGPQGTGVLLCRNLPRPLLAGGTGSESKNIEMPEYLPDRLEAGTHNIPGIAGLFEGVRWVRKKTERSILAHEQALLNDFASRLQNIEGAEMFLSPERELQTGVLSFRLREMDCETLASVLAEKQVAVRAGYHCAPIAHKTAGTIEHGTVRVSFSPFNTRYEIITVLERMKISMKKA